MRGALSDAGISIAGREAPAKGAAPGGPARLEAAAAVVGSGGQRFGLAAFDYSLRFAEHCCDSAAVDCAAVALPADLDPLFRRPGLVFPADFSAVVANRLGGNGLRACTEIRKCRAGIATSAVLRRAFHWLHGLPWRDGRIEARAAISYRVLPHGFRRWRSGRTVGRLSGAVRLSRILRIAAGLGSVRDRRSDRAAEQSRGADGAAGGAAARSTTRPAGRFDRRGSDSAIVGAAFLRRAIAEPAGAGHGPKFLWRPARQHCASRGASGRP